MALWVDDAIARGACKYLNDDMGLHQRAGHAWQLDPGKLHAALEAARSNTYGTETTQPPAKSLKRKSGKVS